MSQNHASWHVFISVGLSGLLTFFVLPFSASAISITPLTFEINVNPGEKIENYVTVFNNDGGRAAYTMSGEDFTAVGESGGVVIDKDAPAAISAKSWLSFEPSTFELQLGESKNVKFTLQVPNEAEPGGKYTSIVVGSAPVATEGGVGFAQKVASLLLIRVAGDINEKLAVKSFDAPSFLEYPPVDLTLRFENNGNVHEKPAGYIFIKNWRGNEVARIPLPQERVIPKTVRAVATSWAAPWLFGKYTANFAGIYGSQNEPLAASIQFWVIPWKLVSVIAGILIVLGLVLFFMRRRISAALRILISGAAR
jgi:hypothetical protein